MNGIKGFRFRPTDEELVEYLQDITFDRDSLVQVIALVPDICKFEPRQLPEHSILQTGDALWYFMYPPKYKYQNSKRISRTTSEGYWKPTGKARKVINSKTGEEIGTKKTLVFYEGQCNDKIRNKTCWVMHEYELKATDTANVSNQKIFNLCKLKKKVDISSTEAGQSSQHTLSNLVNHAISEDLLEPKRSIEPEESNGHGSVLSESSSVDQTHAGERSNQHNIIIDVEGSNISSNSTNSVAEDAIPQNQSREGNVSNDDNMTQNLYSKIEQDSSILTYEDEMFLPERSNQHNIVDAHSERSNQLNIVDADDNDLIPMDLFSLDDLLAELDVGNDPNRIQNQSLTNGGGDGEFLNSITANANEAYLQEENKQHYLAASKEGSGLPCLDVMESSNPKSRKRPRLECDESSPRSEIGEAQPWGEN